MKTCFDIINENATTFADRGKVRALLENERLKVDATMVTNLYKAALEKKHIQFDEIPNSKGDITKYVGYAPMRESLAIVQSLADKYGTKVPEVALINKTLDILEMHRDKFMKGFLLDVEFTQLLYNSVVMGCLEATSCVITSYVDYVKTPESIEFKIVKKVHSAGNLSIQNLQNFNVMHNNGKLAKVLSEATVNKDALVGSGYMAAALVVAGLTTLIPILREIVYITYYSRLKASQLLDHQVHLIELNKKSIERMTGVTPAERKKILDRQEKIAREFGKLSDEIAIKARKGEEEATSSIKKENKQWTIDSIGSQNAQSSDFMII